jgi:hypothetical protein
MGRLEIEVVARPVEVDGEQVNDVEPVLLTVSLAAHEERLLCDAIRGVRLLWVAVPQVVLGERGGCVLRIRADRPEHDELRHAREPALLEHVRAHDEVRMPEAAWRGAVRADAAGERGKVEDELRLRLLEEARCVLLAREVVVGRARNNDLPAVLLEPLDEVRADKAGASRHERLHQTLLQSTRPIQPARFAAYQAMVWRTPSSQETSGFQPVSADSFS